MSSRNKILFSIIGMVAVLTYATVNVLSHSVTNEKSDEKLPLPPMLTNLAAVEVVEIKDAGGQVILSARFTAGNTAKAGDEVERIATLTGTTTGTTTGATGATGKVEIEISTKNNTSEQELEIEVRGLSANTTYRVFVDGQDVAALTTDAKGEAEIEWSSAPAK